MAQIGLYQKQMTGGTPSRATATPVQQADMSVAQGVADVARGVNAMAQAQNQKDIRTARDYTANSKNETAIGLSEVSINASETAKNGDEYAEQITEYLAKQKEIAIEKAPNAQAQEASRAYYDDLIANETVRMAPKVAEMNAARSVQILEDSIAIAENTVFRDPSRFEEVTEGMINEIALSDVPENMKERAAKEITNQLASRQILGQMNQSPELALKRLESGEMDGLLSPDQLVKYTSAAQGQVEALERDREMARNRAVAERNAQIESENAMVLSNLEIAVSRGEAGYQEIEKAVQSGVVSPSKRTQLYKQIDSANKDVATKTLQIDFVSEAIELDQPLDYSTPEHQNSVDAYFLNLPEDMQGNPLTVANIAATTKVLPSQVNTTLSANLRGNAEQVAEAASFVSAIYDVAPEVISQFPADARAMAMGVSKLIAGGTDPVRATELMNNSVYKTTKEQKDVLKLQVSTKDFQGKTADEFKKVANKLSPSWFRSPQRNKAMNNMQAEFTSAVDNYYLLTNDHDTAVKLANADISKVWGVTWANGKEQVMKYAPEVIYGKGEKTPWIYEQLSEELKPYDIKDKHTLTADTQTGLTGSYVVNTIVDGIESPLIINGEAFRYTPDYSVSPQAKVVEEKKKAKIETAKQVADLPPVEPGKYGFGSRGTGY